MPLAKSPLEESRRASSQGQYHWSNLGFNRGEGVPHPAWETPAVGEPIRGEDGARIARPIGSQAVLEMIPEGAISRLGVFGVPSVRSESGMDDSIPDQIEPVPAVSDGAAGYDAIFILRPSCFTR